MDRFIGGGPRSIAAVILTALAGTTILSACAAAVPVAGIATASPAPHSFAYPATATSAPAAAHASTPTPTPRPSPTPKPRAKPTPLPEPSDEAVRQAVLNYTGCASQKNTVEELLALTFASANDTPTGSAVISDGPPIWIVAVDYEENGVSDTTDFDYHSDGVVMGDDAVSTNIIAMLQQLCQAA